MNDFTKEELKGILEALRIIDKDPFIRPEIYWDDSLPDKIQLMIDNYCEHEWRQGKHLFNDIYCLKCNTKFEVTYDNK